MSTKLPLYTEREERRLKIIIRGVLDILPENMLITSLSSSLNDAHDNYNSLGSGEQFQGNFYLLSLFKHQEILATPKNILVIAQTLLSAEKRSWVYGPAENNKAYQDFIKPLKESIAINQVRRFELFSKIHNALNKKWESLSNLPRPIWENEYHPLYHFEKRTRTRNFEGYLLFNLTKNPEWKPESKYSYNNLIFYRNDHVVTDLDVHLFYNVFTNIRQEAELEKMFIVNE